MTRFTSGDAMRGPGPQVVAADALEGDRIVNRRGEDLGTIEEIVIDVQRGMAAYALVSPADRAGGHLFAIPWNALSLDAERRCFELDLDPARFAGAPGFDADHRPSMEDRRWAAQVHGFYGVPPYWESARRLAADPVPVRA